MRSELHKAQTPDRIKNKNFVEKAPKELIEETQARADELETQINAIKELIETLK